RGGGREDLRVIDGAVLFQAPGRACALVCICVDATAAPVGVGRAERLWDIAKVLAGGLMPQVEERTGREMVPERGRDPFRDVRVVIGEGILIIVVEVRRLR